jgi:hypothetical protein
LLLARNYKGTSEAVSGRVMKKVLVQKNNSKTTDEIKQQPYFPAQDKNLEIIWEITPDQLPVNADTCVKADIDTCEYDPNDKSGLGGCYKSCIQYGPEFLAFDEKNGKLYLLADTIDIGTGGGSYLGFEADIATKSIKYLKVFGGPAYGKLSPSGRFLLVVSGGLIDIYDTQTQASFNYFKQNNWEKGHEQLYSIGSIKWLSDAQFSFQQGARHSKFQSSCDEMTEYVYDIAQRKIIHSRLMNKNEYDSQPYVESN